MNSPKPISTLLHKPRLQGIDSVQEIDAESIDIRAIKISELVIEPNTFKYIDISDCLLETLNSNNIVSFKAVFLRCEIKKSQLTGIQLPEGSFKDVLFENCRINFSNFRGVSMERCIFKSCDLRSADFGMSKFTNVLFEDCQLSQADFSNVKNSRLEFIDCELSQINGINGLRGASISSQNLIELSYLFAQELNINVID